MKIEANTLQEAFSQAAEKLNCSVTELEYDIIQNPSSGLLGFFKKSAIIEVRKEGEKPERKNGKKNSLNKNEKKSKDIVKNSKTNREKSQNSHKEEQGRVRKNNSVKRDKITVEINGKILDEIEKGVCDLISKSCFEVDKIEVSKYNSDTVLVFLDGYDAALLIGKDGRRYKAILYMLSNWISLKYSLKVRLEIAEFLKSQEEMIEQYLKGIIEKVNINGKASTKPLDGILVDIALKQLREKFQDKYVGVKSGKDGKFIVINEFKK